jgi:hypothetical protein
VTIAVKQSFRLASEVRAEVIAANPDIQHLLAECEEQLREGKALIKGADAPLAFLVDPLIIQEAEKSLAVATNRQADLENAVAQKIRDGIISGALNPVQDHDDCRLKDHNWDNEDFVSNYVSVTERDGSARRVLIRFADEEVSDFIIYLGVNFKQPVPGSGNTHMGLYYSIKEAFPRGFPETMPNRAIGNRIKKTAAFNSHGLSVHKMDSKTGGYQPTLSRVLGRAKPATAAKAQKRS